MCDLTTSYITLILIILISWKKQLTKKMLISLSDYLVIKELSPNLLIHGFSWLVGQGHPSEKWWTSSIGMMIIPNWMGTFKKWQPNHQPDIQWYSHDSSPWKFRTFSRIALVYHPWLYGVPPMTSESSSPHLAPSVFSQGSTGIRSSRCTSLGQTARRTQDAAANKATRARHRAMAMGAARNWGRMETFWWKVVVDLVKSG